jgi:hypothetical protein
MKIGAILNTVGDAEGARQSFEKVVMLPKDQPQHPLLTRAKALLSPDE